MAQFIQKAIKHPGSFKAYAEKHRLVTKQGTIEVQRAKEFIKRNETGATRTHRLRQANLAATLNRVRA